VDYYPLRAPQTVARAVAMIVSVWSLTPTAQPTVELDRRGNAVPAEVVLRDGITTTVQVVNPVPGADYSLKVSVARPGIGAGDYFLGVDFVPTAVRLQPFVSGRLTADAAQAAEVLTVTSGQLFQFVLSAASPLGRDAAVRMTVFDTASTPVLTRSVVAGDLLSVSVFLRPGQYTFWFAGGTRDGTPLPGLTYALRGLSVGDPIGPQPVRPTDTSAVPVTPPPPPSRSRPPTAPGVTLGTVQQSVVVHRAAGGAALRRRARPCSGRSSATEPFTSAERLEGRPATTRGLC
jgi:hypothetical protein